MKETIDQESLYLLLPIKVGYLAGMLSRDQNTTLPDAIRTIYSSGTYKRLEREESKDWTLGPATLYYDLKHELNQQHSAGASENPES